MTHPGDIPGHPENVPGAPNPSFDCITGSHMFIDIYASTEAAKAARELAEQTGAPNGGKDCVGGWCLWCGTAAYDGERITDDGQPVDFTPVYVARITADWFRRLDWLTPR